MGKTINLALILSGILFYHTVQSQIQRQLDSTILMTTVIAEDLDIPWEMQWAPDDKIWFTERPGRISRVDPETQEVELLLEVEEVGHVSEAGMLGMAIHPNFNHPDSAFIYVVYTYFKDSDLTEKLVRYTYEDGSLVDPNILLDDVPANNNHNGSRIIITPDRKILMTTGDAQNTSLSQNLNSLSGKTLRLNLDGSVPEDNPIADSYIWTIGHRNPQGLVRASNGIIYSSEHGPADNDELNIIAKDGHYGWPDVHGFCDTPSETSFCDDNNVVEPLTAWTPTLAVAGIDYFNHNAIPEWKHSILLATLKEDDLRILRLNEAGDEIISEELFFNNEYGRLRDVLVAPTGEIYIATSNQDGRANDGFPRPGDDKIIQIASDTDPVTGLEDDVPDNHLKLYPNPVARQLSIDVEEVGAITIYDAYSRIILQGLYQEQIDVSQLPAGVYFLEISQENGKTVRGQFLKE